MAALLKGELYNVGQIETAVTYYYDCSLLDDTLGQGNATLKPAASKGRVSATELAACHPAVKINTCSGQVSLAVKKPTCISLAEKTPMWLSRHHIRYAVEHSLLVKTNTITIYFQ